MLSGCNSSFGEKVPAPGQPHTDTVKVNSVKAMRNDLSILWSAIKEMHPGYGIYTNTDSLQRAYNKTYAAIKTPLTEDQFITAIYPFLCELRCGHTQISHSATYKRPVNEDGPHLPFKVLVQNHRAWITTHQTEELTTGNEIISLNDVPVATIINHGYELYNDDGYNETFKELFLSEYDGFEDVCNKYYHWPGPYQLKFRTNTGDIKLIIVNAVKSDAPGSSPLKKADNYANWTIVESIPDSRLMFLNNADVALFKSPPFAYEDTVVFKNAFKLIKQKGIKTLILDVRHNSGGDLRVAKHLLSYLADSAFQIVRDVKSRLPNPAINNFTKYFDTSLTKGFELGFKPAYKEGSRYHIESRPAFGDLYGPFPTDKTDHFGGQLFVLIDGGTFSSGALFSAAVKAQRKGVIFIGRETAGSEEGCNGVTLQKLTLPDTKIIVSFPWMRVVSMAKHSIPGHGIIPGYVVNYSPEDIVTQNDPDLKKALNLIKE
jgi:hypothetical protein